MSIGRYENSINPLHLVTPNRTVVPMPKPFDSPPGVVPFHRMLRSENLAHTTEIEPIKTPLISRGVDTFESVVGPALLPKLGEVLPVAPISIAPMKVQATHQVQAPATGQVLDLYL